MDIKRIPSLLTAGLKADDPILLIGLHGIGKTEACIQWAKDNDIHLEVLYLSNQEVGDLTGIPTVENGVTIWTEPVWLHRLNEASKRGQKTAIFCDEFARAPLDVRQASLQLVLDRKIHQHILPTTDGQRTFIIAADNPDNGDYSVETLDPALLDRFCRVDVELNTESWLDWARDNNVNKIVRAFIAENKDKLHFQPEEGLDETIGATPRSWTKLSKFIDNFEDTPNELYYPIVKGKVGKNIGLQFLNFYKNFNNIISVKDVELLAKTLKKKNNNIENIGLGIKELLQDSEVIQKRELTKNIIDLYFNNKTKDYVLMGILYSLENELLISILKELKEDENRFSKIVELDIPNGKKLFLRPTENLEF